MAAASTAKSSSSSRKGQGTGTALRELAVSTLTTENIFDLIDKLGVKDIVLNRVRARLEELDVDELIDDAVDYVRRHPEVLVVALGSITIAAALVVFLESRHDHLYVLDDTDEEEEEAPARNVQPIKPRANNSRKTSR